MPTDNIKTLRPKGWKPKPVQSGRIAERNKFYDSTAWRKTSRAFRSAFPLCQCERCSRSSAPFSADHVDHIKPINPEDAFDTKNGLFGEPLHWENLQSMNLKCHARKSAKERHANH
jgi:5-methylcytosine-specific restriction protein A